MRKLIQYTGFLITLLFGFTGCELFGRQEQSPSPTPESPPSYSTPTPEPVPTNMPGGSWTFLIYSDADNNLEPNLLSDIEEMMNGYKGGYNVIILIDRIPGETAQTTPFGEDFTDSRLYRLETNKGYTRLAGGAQFPEITTTSTYEANMGDGGTLKKFIEFGKANYPADYYALIFANHGLGPRSVSSSNYDVRSVCSDETNLNDALYTAEITDILGPEHSVTIIGYDACIMAGIEIAYQYRPGTGDFNALYLAASAPDEWADGWNYEALFKRLDPAGGDNGEIANVTGGALELIYNPSNLNPIQLGGLLVEERYDDTLISGGDQSLAFLDLSQAAAVKTKIDALSIALINEKADMEAIRGSGTTTNILEYFNEGALGEEGWISTPFFDLHDLAEGIINQEQSTSFSPEVINKANELMTAVRAFVVYSFGHDNYPGFQAGRNGVYIFFPDGDRAYTYGSGSMWAYQWWYTSLDTQTAFGASYLYGKLSWCADGAIPGNGLVENWFELLDSWFSTIDNGYDY